MRSLREMASWPGRIKHAIKKASREVKSSIRMRRSLLRAVEAIEKSTGYHLDTSSSKPSRPLFFHTLRDWTIRLIYRGPEDDVLYKFISQASEIRPFMLEDDSAYRDSRATLYGGVRPLISEEEILAGVPLPSAPHYCPHCGRML